MSAEPVVHVRSGWNVTATGEEVSPRGVTEPTTDAELVRACVVGEPGAFDTLMARHQRRVYYLCYRFVGNHEDASDLSQEVFLRVHRGLRRFKGRSALSTWVYRIAVNVSLNHVGAKRPVGEMLEPERLRDPRGSSPAELVSQGERADRVRLAIARLPRRQRATLILRVYHELTHREIAEILGTSVGAVKANTFHALANLKKQLIRSESRPGGGSG